MIRHPLGIISVLSFVAALLLLPGPSRADDSLAQAGAQPPQEAATPPSEAPTQAPPPAPEKIPPPPRAEAQSSASVPPGRWVYTQQYGWIWMPYADVYTYAPPDGYGAPYMYVYYPVYGWAWVVAPWVWGWGPWPYFGSFGPWGFAWYGWGWWRFPSRWHFVPPFRGVVAARGAIVGPAPRTGVLRGGSVVAPAPRQSMGARPSGGGGRVRGGHR